MRGPRASAGKGPERDAVLPHSWLRHILSCSDCPPAWPCLPSQKPGAWGSGWALGRQAWAQTSLPEWLWAVMPPGLGGGDTALCQTRSGVLIRSWGWRIQEEKCPFAKPLAGCSRFTWGPCREVWTLQHLWVYANLNVIWQIEIYKAPSLSLLLLPRNSESNLMFNIETVWSCVRNILTFSSCYMILNFCVYLNDSASFIFSYQQLQILWKGRQRTQKANIKSFTFSQFRGKWYFCTMSSDHFCHGAGFEWVDELNTCSTWKP